jgi:metal-responsive CopG/Arc/MetJ family transcriptional regulator
MARTVKRSIGDRKTAGRGTPPGATVRLPGELVKRIDNWAGDTHTRAEAICKLVELGLTAATRRNTSGRQRTRAATLAARQIDEMADASATTAERANRKQRLTDGPSVFRAVRRDQGKANT